MLLQLLLILLGGNLDHEGAQPRGEGHGILILQTITNNRLFCKPSFSVWFLCLGGNNNKNNSNNNNNSINNHSNDTSNSNT